MQTTASLCRAFFSISGDVRGISSASLWSRIFYNPSAELRDRNPAAGGRGRVAERNFTRMNGYPRECGGEPPARHLAAGEAHRLHRDNERFAEWLIAIVQSQLRSHLGRAQHQTKLSCTVLSRMSPLGQSEKSRQRDDAAGLPSTADILGHCRDGR
jgi:hypothetical protein